MISRLNGNTEPDIERIGGKGCGLIRLLRTGLRVPHTWCVVADSKGDNANQDLRNLWRKLSSDNPAPRLAVRSSATAEDLDSASFAGIYETFLDICSEEALVDAVHACQTALNRSHAKAYRDQKELYSPPSIAVLIQELVPADVAGVLLTTNPRRRFADEMTIEAARGLGEAVVSGTTQPDRFILDRRTGDIRRQVSGEKGTKSCLTTSQIRRLFEAATIVESRIGPDRDLEWAFTGDRLFLLQDRPIVGLPPLEPRNVCARKFGDEYLSGYVTPLTNSLLVGWITEDYLRGLAQLSGQQDLAGMEPLRLHQGYAYLNGAYLARMFRALPQRFREEAMQDWFTPLWADRINAEPFEIGRLFKVLCSVGRDHRGSLGRNPTVMKRHCERVETQMRAKLEQDYSKLTQVQWEQQLALARELGREHFRIIRWGMGFHNPALHSALTWCLRRWAGDTDGRLYHAIIAGLENTETGKMNHTLWQLGSTARDDEILRKLMVKDNALERLRERTPNAEFWDAFDFVLARYGHRAPSRDLSQPRWGEQPDMLLGIVRAHVRSESPPPDPYETSRSLVQQRLSAEKKALSGLGRGPLGWLQRKMLRSVITQTQIYTRYRENQRHYLDFILAHVRNLVLEMGRRLTKENLLETPDDVFLLNKEELLLLARGGGQSQAMVCTIAERRKHWKVWRNRVPATYLFDGIETEGEMAEGNPTPGSEDDHHLSGCGASRGVSHGPARVVKTSVDVEQVRAGEILVARNLDPAWTGVFPLISGLVTETGGVLSHGALLAREYGIPAVMGVSEATQRFTTGVHLLVDGNQGSVTLLEGSFLER